MAAVNLSDHGTFRLRVQVSKAFGRRFGVEIVMEALDTKDEDVGGVDLKLDEKRVSGGNEWDGFGHTKSQLLAWMDA